VELTKITPWRTVLLEKLPVAQSVKKFLILYEVQRFIAVFINVYYWALSLAG
jgi:hypothetical protein